jgi:hypothetical protein
MSVFKKNFLPSQSQPWARQIQDKLTDVEARFKTEIINNRTRDEQLQSSYNRLDKAVQAVTVTANTANAAATTANGIINNIYTAGTTNINGSKIADNTISIGKLVANSITGETISGGTITGVKFRTREDGQRVEMGGTDPGDRISFIAPNGTVGAEVLGSYFQGDSTKPAAYLQSKGGWIIIANGSSSAINGTNANAFTVLSGNTQVNNGTFAVGDDDAIFRQNIVVDGRISSDGTYNATPTAAAANLHIFSNGQFVRTTTTSSIEAKENIRPLEFSLENFISVSPVVFDYKPGIIGDGSGNNVIGFIAEDFEAAGFEKLITPPETEGDYKSLRYDKLYMFLHKVVQEQNETIKELTARIEALESR